MKLRILDWLEDNRVLAISSLNALVLVTLVLLIGAASFEAPREAYARSDPPDSREDASGSAERRLPTARGVEESDSAVDRPVPASDGSEEPVRGRRSTRRVEGHSAERAEPSRAVGSTRVHAGSTRPRSERSRAERSRLRDELSDRRAERE